MLPDGIRTHNLDWRAAKDLCLRPRGHHLPHKTLLLLLSFKQFPRRIRTGLTREVRLHYDDVTTRIEMVKGSIVVDCWNCLFVGQLGAPMGGYSNIPSSAWNMQFIGSWCRGGRGQHSEVLILPTVSHKSLPNTPTPTATYQLLSLCYLEAPRFLYIGQGFRYSPENAFYIFNQQIYFIIWYLLDRASLI